MGSGVSPARPPRRTASELAALLGRRPNTAGQDPDPAAEQETADRPDVRTADRPDSGTADRPAVQTAKRPDGRTAKRPAVPPSSRPAVPPSSRLDSETADRPDSGTADRPEEPPVKFTVTLETPVADAFDQVLASLKSETRNRRLTKKDLVMAWVEVTRTDPAVRASIIKQLGGGQRT